MDSVSSQVASNESISKTSCAMFENFSLFTIPAAVLNLFYGLLQLGSRVVVTTSMRCDFETCFLHRLSVREVLLVCVRWQRSTSESLLVA